MRRGVLLAAVLSVLGSVASGQPSGNQPPAGRPGEPCVRIDISYSQFRLPNGLNVVLHEDHTVPMVAVDV